jgi:hypothetical protein
MTIFNATHMQWVAINDATGNVSDSMWIIKNSHGPYNATLLEERQAAAAAARAKVAVAQAEDAPGGHLRGATKASHAHPAGNAAELPREAVAALASKNAGHAKGQRLWHQRRAAAKAAKAAAAAAAADE